VKRFHLRATAPGWGRKLVTVGAAALTIAGGFGLAPGAHADLLVSDIGVAMTSAQSTVTPGKDAFLTAHIYNDGNVGQLSAQMVVNTGGKLDANYTTDPSFKNGTCSRSASQSTLTSDTVVCNYGALAPGASEPSVTIAVVTPTGKTSMTSVASEAGTPDSTVPLPEPTPDNDESATVVTTLSTNSGTAALSDGQSLTFQSADGNETTTFSVPQHGTNGGEVIVQLDEQNTTVDQITCGGGTCYAPAAEAKWTQVGGTPPTTTNPFTTTVKYNNVKQVCNGLGGPSGCQPIFFLPTGQTTGDAKPIPLCTNYTPTNTTPLASSDPCVYELTKVNGIVTYFLAELTDQIVPISVPTKSGV
jgi:hypothetical protein